MVRHLFAHPYHNLHLWQQRDKGYIPVPTLFEDNKRKGRLGTRDPFAEVGSTQRYSCGGMCYELSENLYDELIAAGYTVWRASAVVLRCGLEEICKGFGSQLLESHNVLLVSLMDPDSFGRASLYLVDVGFANGSTKGPVKISASCRETELHSMLADERNRRNSSAATRERHVVRADDFTAVVRGDCWRFLKQGKDVFLLLWRHHAQTWTALYRFDVGYLRLAPSVPTQLKLRDEHYARLLGDRTVSLAVRDRYIRLVGFSKQLRAMINFEFDLHTKKHSHQVIDFETSHLKHSVVFGSFHEGMQTVLRMGLLDAALEHGVVDPDYILNPSTIPECRCPECASGRKPFGAPNAPPTQVVTSKL
jgi:hypothetical protein